MEYHPNFGNVVAETISCSGKIILNGHTHIGLPDIDLEINDDHNNFFLALVGGEVRWSNSSSELLNPAEIITVPHGGTGISSYTSGDLLYASDETTLSKLAKGTSGKVLTMNVGATAPEWADVTTSSDVTVSSETTDQSCYLTFATDQTGTISLNTNSNLLFDSSTGVLTSNGFVGPLTGNADTATISTTITVSDTADTSCSVALFESATGSLAPKTDGSLTYNATTGVLKSDGGFNSNNQKIINVGEPIHPNDATSKTYVDSIAEGLHILEPCLVASFNNFTGTYTHNADSYDATSTLEIDFSTSQEIGNGAVSNNTTLKTGISSHKNLVDLSGDFSITIPAPAPSNGTYVNLQSTSSEHGIGARFNITVVGGNITNLTCIVSGNRYSTSDIITIVVDSKNITLDFSNSNGLVYQIDGLEIVDASDTDYSDVEHVVKYSSILITGVTGANPGVVTTASNHNFTTGDKITIQNVSGMTQVNNKNFTITVISLTTFSIGVDTTLYNTWTSAGSVSKESITTRIFIKNQTNLNENGIYYISQYSSDKYTFTRSDDFNSMYKEGSNDDGDIRPGDYSYISDGIHDANKNHAFVLANEHMNVNGSYVWDGTQTSSHIDPDAILVVAFTGAETIHIDDITIELDGVDRHLQVKDNGISFSKLHSDSIVEDVSITYNNTTLPTSLAVKTYVDSNTSTNITVSANDSTDETVYPVFVGGATGDQGVETDTGLTYNPSSGMLTATNFTGDLTGNADTATNSTTITVSETTDTSCSVALFESGTGSLAPKTDGSLTYNATTDMLQVDNIGFTNGTAAAPSLRFYNDPDTGIYHQTTNCIGFSTTGVLRAYVNNNGVGVIPGTAAQPTFHFSNDPQTGMYRKGSGSNTYLLGFATGGTERLVIDGSGEITHTPSTIATPDVANDKVLIWDYTSATSGVYKKANFADVCFLEGTKFTLSDKSQKNIEDLTLEDTILTYNIENLSNLKNKHIISTWKQKEMKGKFSQSEIRNIWVNPIDKYIIINEKLHVTNYHIIHIRRNNEYLFTFAENVKVGDELLNSNENYEKVFDIQQIHEDINVYNFELLKDMTSFADNYLVHNFCETCSGMSEFI